MSKIKQRTELANKQIDFIEQFRAQLEELDKARRDSEKKAAEYFDKLQRLQADMENLQKITNRKLESVTRRASEGLVLKLLPILDAMQQAGSFAHSGKSLSTEEIAVGLGMLQKQLTDVLRSEGLEEIHAVGQHLDPERHEVVSYVEKDDQDDIVTEEVRRGYLLNGKVIRPSLVIVSKRRSNSESERGTGESSP
ncbi:MAG TPA: nucleotide exchange factor GrpE [Candidatus Bathyarchaeia archaeon]|nr:nucleotide exchange factor GrpE [Candidatus Bathyarchaeia archaeon]